MLRQFSGFVPNNPRWFGDICHFELDRKQKNHWLPGIFPTCENQVAFKTITLYLFLNWKQLTAVKAIEDAVQYIKM